METDISHGSKQIIQQKLINHSLIQICGIVFFFFSFSSIRQSGFKRFYILQLYIFNYLFFFTFICVLIFTIRTVQISHAAVCPLKGFSSLHNSGCKFCKQNREKKGTSWLVCISLRHWREEAGWDIDFLFQFWTHHLTLGEICTTSSGSGLRLTAALRREIKTREVA